MNDIQNHKIKKFFENNCLDLKKFPDDEVKNLFTRKSKYSVYDLADIKSEQARTEIKTILMNLLVTNKNIKQSTLDNVYRPLFYVCSYIKENNITSIFDLNEDTINKFFTDSGIKLNRNNNHSVTKLQELELNEREKDLGLQKTIITYKDCNLSSVRLNLSTEQSSMNFSLIPNKANSDLLRVYIVYLIELTSLTYATIFQIFGINKLFLLYLGDKSLTSIELDDVKVYINNLYKQKFTPNHTNTIIQYINTFLDYLYSKKLISKTFNLSQFKTKVNRVTIENRVDEYALEQIQACLDKLENPYRLMYLIIFASGMRVSEACELPLSCLYSFNKDGKDYYALRFTSEKMHDKSVMNLISKELYDLIDEYIQEERKVESIYLFPAIKDANKPFFTGTCSDNLKAFFEKEKILNADGTPYNYKAHSYRHEIVSGLIDDGTPIYIAQTVCHHQSIEMTTAYAEISKKHKKKQHLQYVTNHGELDLILKEECIGNDALVLSNGFCANPFYDCHQINKCLECEHFRTDMSHLDQFKAYKQDLENALPYYVRNGFTNQAATSKKIIERVSVIINALENLDKKEE